MIQVVTADVKIQQFRLTQLPCAVWSMFPKMEYAAGILVQQLRNK